MRSLLLPTLVLLLTAACDRPSVVVARPDDPAVNRAVDAVWAHDLARVARTGDWILSRSYSVAGDVIAASTRGESLSHASIYDAERGTIIEAIQPVVREVPLASLLRRNRYVVVVRPTGLTEEQRLASVARARAVVGASFDYAGLLGVDRPDRFYCSELVAWASGVDTPGELVVSPADLAELGEVVYFSGARDDAAVQRAALASQARLATELRVASVE